MTRFYTFSLLGVCENRPKDVARRSMEALWIVRMSSPWRDLPQPFGAWHTTNMHFSRWSKKGVWVWMAEALKRDANLEQLFVDSTIVRAQQHATGAPPKRAIKPLAAAGGA